MNTTLDLLKLTSRESDKLTFWRFLDICKDSLLFQKESNQENIISHLNSLLHANTSFENGVDLLIVFLSQCNSDLIGQNLFKWIQTCVKRLHQHNNSLPLYSLLQDLIITSKDYTDVRKQTSLTIIPKIMDFFFKSQYRFSDEILVPFLTFLESILRNYGKSCGNWKNRIEKFLLSQLENTSDVVHASAKCFLSLVEIGEARATEEDYLREYSNKQKFLISALHTQLDTLFNPINEIQGTYDSHIIKYDKKCIPEIQETSSLKRVQRTAVLFTNLAQFLNEMLVGSYAHKEILPTAVFSVICRGLSINCAMLEINVSNDTLVLSSEIPDIHIACISVLDSLIKSCERNLYCHSSLLFKLLTQELKWTKVDCEYGQIKPYSKLRVNTYNCLNTWLTVTRRSSGAQYFINDILPSLLSDIKSRKPTMTLTVSTKRLKGKAGKKERKKNQVLSSTENKVPIRVNPLANRDICEAALNLIPLLLEATSPFISPKIHKILQEHIINEIFETQGALSVSIDPPIPYSDAFCRLGLYKSLLSLCNHHHPKFPPPCNYAMKIFVDATLSERCLDVSRFCSLACVNLEIMLQPIVLPMTYPRLNFGNVDLSNNADEEEQSNLNVRIETSKSDKSLNGTSKHNDSVILASIPDLFENQLSASSENKKSSESDDTNDIDKIPLIENNSDLTSQETSFSIVHVEQDNQHLKRLDKENVMIVEARSNCEGNQEVKETTTSTLQTKHDDTLKRINEDILTNTSQKKKKIEVVAAEVNQKKNVEVNELEVEMLSSFVDIEKL